MPLGPTLDDPTSRPTATRSDDADSCDHGLGYDDRATSSLVAAIAHSGSVARAAAAAASACQCSNAIVWDGRPSLLGGLISEDVRKKKDKIPVLGDLRCWGGFQVESSSAIKKNLVIFVTPTIIDPAGNRA